LGRGRKRQFENGEVLNQSEINKMFEVPERHATIKPVTNHIMRCTKTLRGVSYKKGMDISNIEKKDFDILLKYTKE
jgi:hypothetical protein